MELGTAIAMRRSVREFSDRMPTRVEINEILKAGIMAPNACNMQSWHFYVISEPEKLLLLKEVCAEWVSKAPVVILVCTDDGGIVSRFGDRGRKFPMQDTSLAMENMLLKAVELGLGGCVVGAYKQEKVTQLFDIPKEHTVVALLPIGEPAADIPPRERKNIAEVATFIGELKDPEPAAPAKDDDRPGIRNADARGHLFESCDLSDSEFRNMSMCRADIHNIDLSGTKFFEANLRDTEFSHLNMNNMHFHCSSAIGVTFGGCEECEASGKQCANFAGSTWDNVNMVKSVMNHCDLTESTFTDLRCCDSTVYDIDLDGAKFSGINMVDTDIKCSNLFGSSISNSNLTNVALKSCDIDGMTVDGIDVKAAIEAYKAANGKG